MGAKTLADVLCRPVITEKSAKLQQEQNAYIFEVRRGASKLQIKEAIQKLFEVKVRAIRTMIMPGKYKRYGRNQGKTKAWKKAIVILAENQTIEVLEQT